MTRLFSHLRRGFGENFRFALLAVRAHKLRAVLTVLGIVVGVATVIAMVSIVTGFKNNMVRNFQSFGATLVQFQKFEARFGPDGGDDWERERRRKDLTLRGRDGPEGVDPGDAGRLARALPLEHRRPRPVPRRRDDDAVVVGATPDYSMANNHFVGYGRFVTESDLRHSADRRRHRRGRPRRRSSPARTRSASGSTSTASSTVSIGVFEKKGRMFGHSNDNFLADPVLGLRPPVPLHQERPRRHDPHRDRALHARAGARRSSRRGGRSCAPGGTCPSTSRTTSRSSPRTR